MFPKDVLLNKNSYDYFNEFQISKITIKKNKNAADEIKRFLSTSNEKNNISSSDLIYPIFVMNGDNEKKSYRFNAWNRSINS